MLLQCIIHHLVIILAPRGGRNSVEWHGGKPQSTGRALPEPDHVARQLLVAKPRLRELAGVSAVSATGRCARIVSVSRGECANATRRESGMIDTRTCHRARCYW